MKESEQKNHPHLVMLDEFDGEMDGELKYNKVLYKYRYNAEEVDDDDWAFTREQWGPTDPGFTSIMSSMADLGLSEEEDSEPMHIFRLTSKGRDVASGIKRGVTKLDPRYSSKLSTIRAIAEIDKDRSGSEIEEDEEIQEAKEETYQSKV